MNEYPMEAAQQTETVAPDAATETSGRAASFGAGAAPFASGGDWRSSLPGEWAETLRDVDSPEEAVKALARGLSYHPAERAEDIRLTFPEDFTGSVDEGVQRTFRELCVEQGITPSQAQALLDWQLGADREITGRMVEEGTNALRRSWGSRFEQNRGEALRAFSALDRRMGGELSSSSAGRSMANDPTFVRAFYEIGRLLSEDSLSAGAVPAARVARETAEETYNGMFKGE